MVGLEVPDADAQVAPVSQRQDPPQAGPADRADVAAEEAHDLGLARLDDDERGQHENCGHRRRERKRRRRGAGNKHRGCDECGGDQQAKPAAGHPRAALADLDADTLVADRGGLGLFE